jgi:hypothetical protein
MTFVIDNDGMVYQSHADDLVELEGISMKRRASGSVASGAFIAVVIGLFSLMVGGPCSAQVTADQHSTDVLFSSSLDSKTPAPAITEQPPASDAEAAAPAAPASPQVGQPVSDWHCDVSPYLWFPGVHGTIGTLGRDVSVHATPGDLLSNFRFGLMGVVEPSYKRIVVPLDLVWVRLEDDKALPFPNLMVNKAKLKGSEFILTPKVGYRLVDSRIVKIDALTGLRYWHFSENLKFVPSNLNLNFSNSQNWVDPLVGGRILANLSPKISVSIGGDVGGWNTGSVLDYQIAGVLGYRIKPAVVLQAGYRYLAVDYRKGGTTINTVTSGVLFGATITLK